MNLTGWEYILSYGYSLDLYTKGNRRVAMDRNTGRVVLDYII